MESKLESKYLWSKLYSAIGVEDTFFDIKGTLSGWLSL